MGDAPELLIEWVQAPDSPPESTPQHPTTMENRPGGVDGQELREVGTGAWLASDTIYPVVDAIDPIDT